MNPKQRMLAVLTGDPTDRVPWAPELNAHFIDKLLNQTYGESLPVIKDKYLEGCRLIGADMLGTFDAVKITRDNVAIVTETDGLDTTTAYNTPIGSISMRKRSDTTALTEYVVDYLLKTPQDFKVYQYILKHTHYEARAAEGEAFRDLLGTGGIASILGQPTPLMDLIMSHMGLERSLFNLFDYPAEMQELMDAMHAKNLEYYEAACTVSAFGVIRPFEDTSSTLTSPNIYRDHCIGHLNDYADICHKHGKLFLTHMCGFLKNMLPLLAKTKIDGIEALTPPPLGDTPAVLAWNALGSDRIIIGGLDPNIFSFSSKEEVASRVKSVLAQMKGHRRFMLGCEEISAMADVSTVLGVPALLD